MWGVFLFFLAVASAEDADPLVRAIRGKTPEQLRDICNKASIACPADADRNQLAALVYEYAQNEVPAANRKPIKPWPGLDEAAATAASASTATQKPLSSVASMLFNNMDKNKDGKLAKEEMQPIIDATNKQAVAKGEAAVDLFAQLDADKDGSVSREEADGFFRKMEAAQATGKAPAAAQKAHPAGGKGNIADALFGKLDTDADGMLSREEMAALLAASDAQAKQRGEAPQDFFGTLDADGSGKVDRKEAELFFQQMVQAGLMGDTSGKGIKDEV